MKIGMIRKNLNLDFMKYRKIFLSLSLLLCILALVVSFTKGLNIGVDFKGGVLVDLKSKNSLNNKDFLYDIASKLGIKDVSIKEFGNNEFQLLINSNNFKDTKEISPFLDILQSELNDNYVLLQSQFVGPSISAELLKSAIYAILGALLGVFIYLWARFDWQYGLIGIITLIHDVLIAFLFLAIFNFEINTSTIAGLLTIIGYSINDTVVVFDQVRENVKKYIKYTDYKIINMSINQVFSRSLSTSITLLIVLLSLFILGGNTLRSFSFILLIGVSFGTYSSVCIAAPLLNYLGNIKSRYLKKENND